MTFNAFRTKAAAAVAIILTAALGLSGCGPASAQGDEGSSGGDSSVRTIKAITGGSPAPYIFRNKDGQLDGENYQLVKKIFEKLPQYKIEYDIADFSAIFGGLDSGRYQIAVNNLSKNPEREKKYIFSDPIYQVRYYLEVPNDSTIGKTPITSWADLAGKTALLDPGVQATNVIEQWNKAHPDKAIKTKYVGTGSDITSKLRAVEGGQADFAIDDIPVFNYYKKAVNLSLKGVEVGDEINKEIGDSGKAYLVFPKEETKLRDDVNKALKELVDDGTSTDLNNEWFGEDLTVKE